MVKGAQKMDIENKKLYHSPDDRKIAGICGGLGEYLNIDSRLLRWAFVLTAQVTAPLYLLMWVYLGEEPIEQLQGSHSQDS
jgi:phage shock protein PspC (stress-responsive transcriptional regulator)